MNLKFFAAGLLTLALVSPAAAQSVPDDLRCFMLSNIFARTDKDDKRRMIAAQASIFYLGRLDGKVNAQMLAPAMHAHLDPKLAGPQMTACAQHLGRAEQTMQATIKSVAPPPAPKH